MKSAIVTGATGFIGQHLVNELLSRNIKVTAVVRDESRKGVFAIRKNLTVISCPMEQINLLPGKLPAEEFDVFYHLAWEGILGTGRCDIQVQTRNVEQTIACIESAKKLSCTKFVNAGSITEKEVVFDTFTQECKPSVTHIYSAAKLMSHCAGKAIAAEIGIDYICGVTSNTYGAGDVYGRIIPTTIKKIICNEPLRFTAGTKNYDFIYVSDVAKAFYLLGKKGVPFCYYTIGSGNAKSLKEFILEIKQILAPDREFLLGAVPFTGTSLPLSDFSIEDLTRDTGFKPEVPFDRGVRLTYDWIVNSRVD